MRGGGTDPLATGLHRIGEQYGEDPWHEQLREHWRPASVRLLLIGESAPDSGAVDERRRFFYAPTLSRYDSLFRGVVEALYGPVKLCSGDDRGPWLERLRRDGVYLIDLVPYPVNKLSSGERRRALKDHADDRVGDVLELAPEGVIICPGPTFEALAGPFVDAGVGRTSTSFPRRRASLRGPRWLS